MMMQQQAIAKNRINYENEHKKKGELKQKPIKNYDEFSDSEE